MVAEPLPPVSVVIPVRNEATAVGDALRSALGQDYQGPLEVVVAVAPSDDGTDAVVEQIAADDDRVSVVPNPAGSTPAGLNAAIAASTGDVVVRCDAHSVLPGEYVTKAVNRLLQTGAANVGGVQAAIGSDPMQRAIGAAMSVPFGVGDARFHMGGAPSTVDTVYLGVFRRDAIEAVGLYDETLERNQDYELNIRLRVAGGTVYFDPDLVVEYRPRATLGDLWRQHYGYGRWKRVVARLHPGSVRWRQLMAPALIVALVGSVALAVLGRWYLAALVPLAYLITATIATVVELVRRRDAAMLLLPLVFPTMHLSWGLGFLRPGQPGTKES